MRATAREPICAFTVFKWPAEKLLPSALFYIWHNHGCEGVRAARSTFTPVLCLVITMWESPATLNAFEASPAHSIYIASISSPDCEPPSTTRVKPYDGVSWTFDLSPMPSRISIMTAEFPAPVSDAQRHALNMVTGLRDDGGGHGSTVPQSSLEFPDKAWIIDGTGDALVWKESRGGDWSAHDELVDDLKHLAISPETTSDMRSEQPIERAVIFHYWKDAETEAEFRAEETARRYTRSGSDLIVDLFEEDLRDVGMIRWTEEHFDCVDLDELNHLVQDGG